MSHLEVPPISGPVQGAAAVAVALVDVGAAAPEQLPHGCQVPTGGGLMQRRLALPRMTGNWVRRT